MVCIEHCEYKNQQNLLETKVLSDYLISTHTCNRHKTILIRLTKRNIYQRAIVTYVDNIVTSASKHLNILRK